MGGQMFILTKIWHLVVLSNYFLLWGMNLFMCHNLENWQVKLKKFYLKQVFLSY